MDEIVSLLLYFMFETEHKTTWGDCAVGVAG